MPSLAIYALIALFLVGAGFTTAYKLGHEQVNALEMQIRLSNEDARRKLLGAISQTEAAEQTAALTNILLETEHAKTLKINVDLAGALANVRMRVPTQRTNCNNPVPKGAGSTVAAGATDTTELPAELEGLLRSEAYRADTLAAYAAEAHQFISANCGIKPTPRI